MKTSNLLGGGEKSSGKEGEGGERKSVCVCVWGGGGI